MTTEINFNIYVDEESCLNEYEVTSNFDKYYSSLVVQERYEGWISVHSPVIPGGYLEIEDDLGFLVHRLCFLGAIDLANHKKVMISFFTYDANLQLDPEAEFVILSGDHIPTVKLETAELLPALYSCGLRYIDLLHKLVNDRPGFAASLKRLEDLAVSTEQALKSTDLI